MRLFRWSPAEPWTAAVFQGLAAVPAEALVTRRCVAQHRTMVVSVYKMTLRIKAMRNDKRKFKSSAFQAIHESAVALHKIGAIDSAAMEDFDVAALQTSPTRAAPDVDLTDKDR
jgi:hypothetical protein